MALFGRRTRLLVLISCAASLATRTCRRQRCGIGLTADSASLLQQYIAIIQVRHNVQGRSTYAEGTVDAALFLAAARADGVDQRRFSMIDVLRQGSMS